MPELDKWNLGDQAPDYIFIGDQKLNIALPESLDAIQNYSTWETNSENDKIHPYFTYEEYMSAEMKSPHLNFVEICLEDILTLDFKQLISENTMVFVIKTNNKHGYVEQRRAFIELSNIGFQQPVIICREYEIKILKNYGFLLRLILADCLLTDSEMVSG